MFYKFEMAVKNDPRINGGWTMVDSAAGSTPPTPPSPVNDTPTPDYSAIYNLVMAEEAAAAGAAANTKAQMEVTATATATATAAASASAAQTSGSNPFQTPHRGTTRKTAKQLGEEIKKQHRHRTSG